MARETFDITGMTCSACSARVEKGVSKLAGIESVNVNLLKNNMSVTFDKGVLSAREIINQVEDIGYGATLYKKPAAYKKTKPSGAASLEQGHMKRRLIVSIAFTLPLFYISMGEMWSWPLPEFLTGMENAMVYAFTQFLLAIPVLIAGGRYFRVGLKSLVKRSPNMDSLIAIGSGAALLYGIYAIYKIAWGLGHGDMDMVHSFSMSLYFESAAIILTLITLGKYFEARAKSRTSEAIAKLMDLTPKTAIVLRDGEEREIPADEVVRGDVLIVKAGAAVPADGVMTDGHGALDESAITGESLPADKSAGDKVTGGTINKSGYFKMEATAVGEDTALAKIIRLVDEATSSKAPIAKLADKISGVFVPAVILIAAAAAIVWLALGKSFEFSLSVSISVLVISCPCALGLATPTAIMVGTGRGAANGILIKSAESLELAHSIDTVVLDKTGTVTEGKPAITDVRPGEAGKERLLAVAASLEKMSGHPFAGPIITEAERAGVSLLPVEDYELIPGRGIAGIIDGEKCYAGNRKLMEMEKVDIGVYAADEETLADEGKTPLFFASGGTFLGIIAMADVVKPTSKATVKRLSEMGIEVIMLTGDNKRTADAIRREVGIGEAMSEVPPEDKERRIRALQELGRKVAMVGDGINDAPALARADVGIAIGAGTDVAIESSDIVLMKSDLMDVPSAISLSKAVMRNIKQNLFWAFIYNVVGIPVAAGALYAAFDILLNPMIAAAAMSFSSVSVVTNALRLRFFTPKWKHGNMRMKAKFEEIKEEISMTKVIKIEGMSCRHCSSAVEKALGAVEGVSSVSVDPEGKLASVELSGNVPDTELKSAVKDAGYDVVSIE